MPEAYYRFRAEIIRRGQARGMKSALVAAAYRSGQRLEFEREDTTIDYTRRRGVMDEGILTPEAAPGWMKNREDLWNAIESKEKRCDARLARDFTLSLPHQMNEGQMREAVTGFLEKQFVSRGLVCDFAIHAPSEGDKRNYHAHTLVTERPANEHGFSPKKDRSLIERGKIEEWRAAWQDELNRIFERDQIRDRKGELYFVDRRSYKERGIEKEAQRHMGPGATAMERDGVQTDVGDFNRQIARRNKERDILRDDLAEVEQQIEAEQRQHEKYHRLFGDGDQSAQAQEPDEARKARMRALFGDQVDTDQSEDAAKLRTQDDVRRRYREAGVKIDDAEPQLKPKPRDLGLGRGGPNM